MSASDQSVHWVSVPHQAALPASASMCSQCLAINFAASLETRSKSLPTSERHSESSGWADQPTGAVRYFEIEPESRMKAQSAFAVLQADNRNTVAIRSGPSCSSMIVSAKRTYFSDCAAIEAPAEKVLESLPTETRRVGAVKANIDHPPATLPSDSLIASKARRARTRCPAVSRRVSPHFLSGAWRYLKPRCVHVVNPA